MLKNKKGKDGGIITFLAVLGVVFLIWLGFTAGKGLCESGTICDNQNTEDNQQEIKPTKNDTTNIKTIVVNEGGYSFPAK